MRVAFLDTIVFDKFLISPKLYIFIFCCSTATYNTNDSKCRHWKTIKYYTDEHNVDEDLRTISLHGGDWGLYWSGTISGVFLRIMGEYSSPTGGLENVASLKNIGHPR